MSNPSPIRAASTRRFTLSTFTLRTDEVTYLSPGGDCQQVCKRSILSYVQGRAKWTPNPVPDRVTDGFQPHGLAHTCGAV